MEKMEKVFYIIIILFGILFGILVIESVESAELDKLYIEYEKAIWTNRHYELNDPFNREGSLNLGMNINLSEDWFWNNRIESTYGISKFEQVAWRFDLGFNIEDNVQLYFNHYSSHTMDSKQYRNINGEELRYPEMNSIGVRWYIK